MRRTDRKKARREFVASDPVLNLEMLRDNLEQLRSNLSGIAKDIVGSNRMRLDDQRIFLTGIIERINRDLNGGKPPVVVAHSLGTNAR
jgi:hypothetical protein